MVEPNIQNPKILYITFNQDSSCFAIGTETGFSIYKSYPLNQRYTKNMNGGIGIIEMMNRSNILALVGGGDNPKFAVNKVIIWDDYQEKIISEIRCISKIKSIRVKRDRLFIVCTQKIYIFSFLPLENIENIQTIENPKGIVAISAEPNTSILAYLNKPLGSVTLKDVDTSKDITIHAHTNMIGYMTFNSNGTLLATCSEKGTLIRIFNATNGDKIQELRRGTENAEIYCLAFDLTGTFLVCSSDRKTVHIFKLIEKNDINYNEDMKNNKSVFAKVTTFLGFDHTYFNSEWSYTKFKINDTKTVCAFGPDKTVIAISIEGNYYQASYENHSEGRCEIIVFKNIHNN